MAEMIGKVDVTLNADVATAALLKIRDQAEAQNLKSIYDIAQAALRQEEIKPEERRLMAVKITPEIIVECFRQDNEHRYTLPAQTLDGFGGGKFEIHERRMIATIIKGIPKDAKLVATHYDQDHDQVVLIVGHPSFRPQSAENILPEMEIKAAVAELKS